MAGVKFAIYATHLPLLGLVLSKFSGDVLELGCGAWSTPFLCEMCKRRNFISFERDADWAKEIRERNYMTDKRHELITLKPLEDYRKDVEEKIRGIMRPSVVFVDHSPETDRAASVQYWGMRADVVVIHDTSPNTPWWSKVNKDNRMVEAIAAFPHKYVYDKLRPGTTAVSRQCDLEYMLGDSQ